MLNQVALEKQRLEYERQFQQLRSILSPSTPYSPYLSYDPLRGSQGSKILPYTPTTQMRVEKWANERDEMFKRSLGQLKADILKANVLVQEANFLAEEMLKQTKFSVTLQIPPNNLSPNRKVRQRSLKYKNFLEPIEIVCYNLIYSLMMKIVDFSTRNQMLQGEGFICGK